LTLSVSIREGSARVRENLNVEIGAVSSTPVVDAPLHLLYDPERLRFVDATEGEYMKQDGGGTVFMANGLSRPGDVLVGIGRTDRLRGVSGSGTLCRLRFEVLAPGTATFSIGQALAWSPDGSLVPVTTHAAEITVP
jgi:hypothetical protein